MASLGGGRGASTDLRLFRGRSGVAPPPQEALQRGLLRPVRLDMRSAAMFAKSGHEIASIVAFGSMLLHFASPVGASIRY